MKKIWTKALAYVLAVTMCFSIVNVPVYAQGSTDTEVSTEVKTTSEAVTEGTTVSENDAEPTTEDVVSAEEATTDGNDGSTWDQVTTEDVFEGENYKVTFTLTSNWDTGYNANIKLENTGDSTMQNWYLGFDYNNSITNIWNAEIASNEDNEYVIKNVGWNQDIAVGNSIEFGISGDHSFKGFPESCELIGTSTEVTEADYAIQYIVDSDWGTGFYGSISVTNNTDTALEDWVLEFDFDREITEIWDGIIDEHEDNHYVIRNAEYNSNIAPGECVSIGIKGCNGKSGDEPIGYALYSYGNNDENIEIKINKNNLKKDERFDYYYVTDKTCGIGGTLTNSSKVKSMSYEVKDYNGTVIENGSINTSESWNAENMRFTLGANFVTVKAILKSGKEIETEIIILNDRIDYLSSELDVNDSDGDTIPNFVEQYFGTDCYNKDTDGDNLSDYDELYLLGSIPTLKDTDSNGTDDAYEDCDGDGLVAIEEIEQQTNPFIADSDDDGLVDGEEVHKYCTKPDVKDTDKDGVNDGKEIEIATDPLVAENEFKVTATAQEEDSVKVSVSTSLSGNQVETLSVHKFTNDFLFPTTMPGYIGGAYDFNVEGTFSSATLRFEFDKSLLENESFEPIIYYYNEEKQQLEELPTLVTDNVATTTVSHFSTYILLNRKVYEDSFEWQDVWSTTGYSNVEVILVIDDSGSMYSNDYSNQRLTVAKNLVDNLPENSRVGIVKFTSSTSILTKKLTDDREAAKNYLTTTYFKSNGGTNMYNAINSSFSLFESTDDSTLRMMVVLSDGATSDTRIHSSVVSTANEKGVKIYTVGLGRSTTYFNSYLKPLANNTGATFYLAANASQLEEIYKDINKKIDIETDSDGDGIADYYEDNMVMFNGVTITLEKDDPDSDNDGLLDGDEIVDLNYEYNADKTKVIVTGKILSNPLKEDSDDDGILDADDPEPYKHFGLFNNNVDFKLTDSVKVPYNSAIESAKQVTIQDYNKIWRERAADTIDNEYLEALYILNIQTRAYMLLGFAYGADGVLALASGMSGKQLHINDGCYFLAYYLSCLGGYVEYDGTFPAVGDSNGLEKYNSYVDKLLNVCESGTKEGKAITFTQIDSACGDTPINYCANGLQTLNYWLAVKGGHIGMAGECSYDGLYYNLNLIYCIQDYYDFYYEDPKGGQDSIGLVNNDEMAFLKLFGAAENFENCGVYHVNIRWTKGQSLSEAVQTPLGYSYVGK